MLAARPGDVRLTEVVPQRAAAAADRDRHGHTELTDAVKERVLGLNATERFGLDPDATRCELSAPWVPPGPVSRGQMQRGRAHENGPWIPTRAARPGSR
jgi:hypothetical protein